MYPYQPLHQSCPHFQMIFIVNKPRIRKSSSVKLQHEIDITVNKGNTIVTYPLSPSGHMRLGPITIAILPGVILFTSDLSTSFAKNLIKYLENINKINN